MHGTIIMMVALINVWNSIPSNKRCEIQFKLQTI